jgi:hypothetical protein
MPVTAATAAGVRNSGRTRLLRGIAQAASCIPQREQATKSEGKEKSHEGKEKGSKGKTFSLPWLFRFAPTEF